MLMYFESVVEENKKIYIRNKLILILSILIIIIVFIANKFMTMYQKENF